MNNARGLTRVECPLPVACSQNIESEPLATFQLVGVCHGKSCTDIVDYEPESIARWIYSKARTYLSRHVVIVIATAQRWSC